MMQLWWWRCDDYTDDDDADACSYIAAADADDVPHVQRHTSSVRLGIVHNVDVEALTQRTATGHLCIARAVDVALETLDVGVAKMFVTKLVKEENVEALTTGAKTWDDLAVSVSGFLLVIVLYF